jgi:tetratricopeptide (TPR) repeat protein
VYRQQRIPVVCGLLLLLVATTSLAQSTQLNIPRDSQRASVSQRVGITDITVNYHRPLVKGRTIWGKVVPYGQVWRAGANENTIITFTDPVTVEGKPLDKGTYGLHMLPAEDQWTVIFSKVNTAWGSFTYKESEDALRVTVKPQPADFHEALAYDIDQPSENSAVVTMRWEKIAVPFKVSVDVNDIVAASLQHQLRGLSQYTWDGWDDAATFLLTHKVHLDEALQYEDKSIQVEERYDNYQTKSQILEAMGKNDDAKAAHSKALALASPQQLHQYAFQLKGEKKDSEAYAVWSKNAKDHPDLWFTHSGMARVYSAQGDFGNALKEMKIAESGAPEQNKPFIEAFIKRLEAKDDINK